MRVAYEVGKQSLPTYAHRFSPKKFTQPQLFACLVLKTWLRRDYRSTVALLADAPDLCRTIDLTTVPHFTTLQKAVRRLLQNARVQRMLNTTVARIMKRRRRVHTAAADSSGFDLTHASRYYVWRAKRMGFPQKHLTYRRFPKLGIICDTQNHAILAAMPTRGPTPDIHQLGDLLSNMTAHPTILQMVADAGYDSESNHCLLREEHGIRSVIPPGHGRPSVNNSLPRGRYRRLMKQRFDRKTYRRRSQVETVVSMLKRNLDGCVRARGYKSQARELLLKVLTHNVMILLFATEVFYRARPVPFSKRFPTPSLLCCDTARYHPSIHPLLVSYQTEWFQCNEIQQNA